MTEPTASTMQQSATGGDSGEPVALEGVRFGYRSEAPVIRGVSARLRAGRVCALIGPNASGKSTLLKLMLGQLLPDRGRITLNGRDVAALSPRERAKCVGYVPQRGGASFAFTVREVVEMGRYAAGRNDAAVAGALAACDLEPIADRPFTELSGGQQQRVLVARALAQVQGGGRPPILLLDEPTSSLDLRHVHGLLGLMRRQAADGAAVLVVLHDVNLAARYADDVWLMDGGRLVASGTWGDVLRPELLQPVYLVRLREAERGPGGGRPVFVAEPEGTLE